MLARECRLLAEAASGPLASPAGRAGADDAAWPSRRPSLAYQWALDVAASELYRLGGPVVLVASHPVLGPEAARRLAPLGAASAVVVLGDAPSPPVSAVPAASLPTPLRDAGPRAALWIEPTADCWQTTLGAVGQALAGSGRLCVVTSSPWLAGGLPEWSAERSARRALPGGWQVERRLGAAGWSVEWSIGLRGPRSLALGALGRLAALARRDALADRLALRMRQHFVERGLLAHLSTVALVWARPPAEAGRSWERP